MEMNRDGGTGLEALSLLSLCDLFSDIDASAPDLSDLAHLNSEIAVVHLGRGDVLMKQGDASDCMYALIRGRLHVLVGGPDGEQNVVGELRTGETVGELGLLDGSVRMATITAVRDSQVVRLSAAGFERIVRSNPGSLSRIARSEAERMRSMGQRRTPTTSVKTIAVMAAGAEAGIESFTAALCRSLNEFGTVLHLSRSRFEGLYRRPFEVGEGISAWLGELEGVYRFVVWETDPEADAGPSAWTLHSLRQADRIITVSAATGSPTPSATERAVFTESSAGRMAAVELVLLHESAGRVFSRAQQWLAPRQIARHHHVCRNVAADVDRVARFLAGRAVGLTLGGGGARGFAHIGVLRAIEEAGIPVDMICGVSSGAIVAALYAMGHNPREIARLIKQEYSRRRTPDFSLPVIALTTGSRFRSAMESFFGRTAIEDLRLSYFCNSCDLSSSEVVIHRTGSLTDAVRASNAVPGVLPPFVSGGHLLIDGGVLNNQPGDVMKDLCGGPVIVVNVSPRKDATVDAALTEMPTAWRVLRSRMNPFEPTIRVPGIGATIMRTLTVASERKSREVERMADYYLRPPISGFRVDEYSRIDEIAEAGYQYTREEIRGWKESGRLLAPDAQAGE